MKTVRQLHLYLGCIFAPLIVVFAISGAAQVFGLRLGILSEAHLKSGGSFAFAVLAALMGVSMVVTAFTGVRMAFRSVADRRTVWACLAFGTIVPALLLLVAYLRQ